MPEGYLYVLKYSDGTYYTGSTKDLEHRLHQHQNGEGAIYTKRRLPVELIYSEEFPRIDEAFFREKQIQGWKRSKKEAYMQGRLGYLPKLSRSKNLGYWACWNVPPPRYGQRRLRQAQSPGSGHWACLPGRSLESEDWSKCPFHRQATRGFGKLSH